MKLIQLLLFCFFSVNAYSSEQPKNMQMSCDISESAIEGDKIVNTKFLAHFQSDPFSRDERPINVTEELPAPYQEVSMVFNYTKTSFDEADHKIYIPTFMAFFDYRDIFETTLTSVQFDIKDPIEGSSLYLSKGFIFNPERYLSYICSLTFLPLEK